MLPPHASTTRRAGATYAAQIKGAMAASGSLKQVTEFVATPDGKKAYDAFIANVQASPMAVYLDELRGIAAGAFPLPTPA